MIRSFLHDKHEAFRFKYDPNSLRMIEKQMNPFTIVLYVNALIFYIICFACPMIFIRECGHGIHPISHWIYGVYSLVNAIIEIVSVIKL